MNQNGQMPGADTVARQELPTAVHELPRWIAITRPDQTALSDPERRLSYRDLAASVDRVCERLRDHGVRPGDRVAVVLENYVAAAVALFAVSACGAIVTPVNARIAPPEVAAMFAKLRPRCTVYVGSSDAARGHGGDDATIDIGDDLIGALLVGPIDDNVAVTLPPVPALIMFTSGTTGRPKGVMHSQASLIYQGTSQAKARKVTSSDTLYIVAPLSHTIGLGSNLVTACVVGAEAFLSPRFDPVHLARAIADGRVTFLVAVPQVYTKLLDTIAAEKIDLQGHRMRVTGTGGAPVDVALKERMKTTFSLPFGNGYGCTEMTPITRVPDGIEASGAAIGLEAPGCEVRIVKIDGNVAGTDEVGEIWARGPSRMIGYFEEPDETSAAITPDGWLKTGDMGRRDASGQYFIVGRNKDLIIRSGFNVYPAEIEAVLNEFPGVNQSAVVGKTIAGDEAIIAFVETATNASVQETALLAFCRARLSGYKVPQTIQFGVLPIGPTGKVLKKQLQKQVETP